nr:phage tail tube protein [Roseomonas sp. GC11]
MAYCLEPAGSAPVMQTLAFTSAGINPQVETYQDEAITPDGNVGDMRQGGRSANVSLVDHLCYGAHDAFLAGALRGDWVDGASVSGVFSAVAATGAVTRATGSFVEDGFETGDVIELEGFATEGEFRVKAVSAGSLLLDGDLEDETGVTATVRVVGSKLKNGTKHVDFLFQMVMGALAGRKVRLGHSTRLGTIGLSFPNTGLIGIDAKGVALDMSVVAAPLDASPRPLQRRRLLTAFDGEILLAGETLGTATDHNLNIDNAPNGSSYYGSRTKKKLLNGKFKLSGDVTIEPEDDRLITLLLDEGEAAIWGRTYTEDGEGWYVWHLPRVKLSGEEETIQGEGAVSAKAEFTALKSAEHGCTLVIQRRHPVA